MAENSKRSVQFEQVGPDYEGQRLDNFLMSRIKGVPKSLIYRIIRKGEVRINKGRTKPDYRLKADDMVRIPPVSIKKQSPVTSVPDKVAANIESAILFEDDYLIAVNKPKGLAVHGGSGIKLGLIEALRVIRPDEKRLELVHRLDRDTSGVILVAKKRSALVALHKMLQTKSGIRKRYVALVYGNWPKHVKQVDTPLKKNELKSGERIVRVSPEGKPSQTRIGLERRYEGYTLINAEPITGRTHQIRVHCQCSGHPIVGDEKYAADDQIVKSKGQGATRLFLHAQSLKFKHPATNDWVLFEAPLDRDWQYFIGKLHPVN